MLVGGSAAFFSRMARRASRGIHPAAASLKGGLVAALLAILCTGCTSWQEYLHNGFKVGPNYREPCTATADHWIDSGNPNINSTAPNDAAWWQTLNDPVLNALIYSAYRQNLTLRVAGWRIMEVRAQRNIAAGDLFPQTQQATGSYTRTNSQPEHPRHRPAVQLRPMAGGHQFGVGTRLLGAFSPGHGSGRCNPRCVGGKLR